MQYGFTLIELSIVLVVIGLLVGGVLVGKDMIKSAEVRAQMTQIEKLNTATNTFRQKYNGLPGDIYYLEAQKFGLTVISYAPNIGSDGYGDANGLIQVGHVLTTPITGLFGEPFMFFRHLSDANLIDGKYCDACENAAGPNGPYPITGNEVFRSLPEAKIGKGASLQVNSPGDGRNYIVLTKVMDFPYSFYTNGTVFNPLTAQEAFSIDKKIDDALPATGNVFAINGTTDMNAYATWTTVSVVSGCVTSSAYAITQNIPACSLRFKLQ